MVLQRDQPVPVWGKAAPGAQVRIDFAGRQVTVKAAADGNWRAQLAALRAGGPYVLSIDDKAAPKQLHDVYVGEVWLASGQSNMEWPLAQTDGAEAAIAAANDPLIRHFKIPKSWAGASQWQLNGGDWRQANPRTAGDFSAVAYYFAQQLRARTGVAVGIIDSTWGGSTIEAWTDAATQGLDGAALAAQAAALRDADANALQVTHANLARWPQLLADASHWHEADADAAQWTTITVPGLWESQGWNGMDGVAWYRASFRLSADEAARGVILGVGRIDDSDTTWVNGQQVGETKLQYNLARRYSVPASALHAGLNHVAVRVQDFGGGGGIHGEASEVFVQPQGAAARALDGWSFRVESAQVALVDDKNQHPTLLYNAMIHPLQDYGVRGVLWYQGESNANTLPQAQKYRQQFPALITQWRAQWKAPALPFLWVQLAPFSSGADKRDADDVAVESPWALLRESQGTTLALPATAQVVITDVGDVHDIHPRNKRTVGDRLALAAGKLVYGDSTVIASGPSYVGHDVQGSSVVLRFDAGAAPLQVGGGGELKGFEVAGSDGHFHRAQARIDSNRVILQSRAVQAPVAARYGWSDTAQGANLTGATGLPASPFRTGP
ncbi:MAG: sialate O-acetylesterase [Stenotrophomonas sp.]|uniref:sialate O-acetylesterase n=1 Tax=Stenotrophomonas sp. TaxID=69392 RepID=UPI003D6CE230